MVRYFPRVARRLEAKRRAQRMPPARLYWVPTLFESIQRDLLANALWRYPEQRDRDVLRLIEDFGSKGRGVTFNAPDISSIPVTDPKGA